jgi:hypothetical protein
MQLINNHGVVVDKTLKAIASAIDFDGPLQTEDGLLEIKRDNYKETYVVTYKPLSVDKETWTFDNIEEAYIKFRFLFGAYYQENLPSL